MDHWVLVDDTSSTINYAHSEGSAWTPFSPSDNDGLHPPDGFTFLNTLHVGTGNVSLTYNFTGTAVEIGGFSRHLYADTAVPTKISCMIDGEPALIESGRDSTLFSHDYCVGRSLTPGEHIVQLALKVDFNSTFLFDRVRYVPLEGANSDNLLVGYNQTHKSITYQGGWQEKDGVKISTETPGTLASVVFNGTSLQWIGALLPGFSHNELKVVYTLDNGPKHTFSISDIQNPDLDYPAVYDRVLFDTGPIPPGNHVVRVVPDNQDIGPTIPLTLSYLIVQNIPSGSGSPSGSLAAGASSTSGSVAAPAASSSAQWTGLSTATIAGIAVGSAFVIILVVAIVVIRTRPSAQRARKKPLNSESVAPFSQISSSRSTSTEHRGKAPVSELYAQEFKSRTNSCLTTGLTMLSASVETHVHSPHSQRSTNTILNIQAPSLVQSLHSSSNRTSGAVEGTSASNIWSPRTSITRETVFTEELPSYSETWESSR